MKVKLVFFLIFLSKLKINFVQQAFNSIVYNTEDENINDEAQYPFFFMKQKKRNFMPKIP